jgi:hypothetical protein
MADVGLSQVRQVGNLGNSPAGQTGLPDGYKGDAYGAASDTSLPSGHDASSSPAKLHSGLSSTGTGLVNDSRGDPYGAFKSLRDGTSNSSTSQQRPTTRKP